MDYFALCWRKFLRRFVKKMSASPRFPITATILVYLLSHRISKVCTWLLATCVLTTSGDIGSVSTDFACGSECVSLDYVFACTPCCTLCTYRVFLQCELLSAFSVAKCEKMFCRTARTGGLGCGFANASCNQQLWRRFCYIWDTFSHFCHLLLCESAYVFSN